MNTRSSRRAASSKSSAQVSVPPSSDTLKMLPRLELAVTLVPSDTVEVYLYYTYARMQSYPYTFAFSPSLVSATRLLESTDASETLRGPFSVGKPIHVAYYTELKGNSAGMTPDWKILGAYSTLEQATSAATKAKNTYVKDYYSRFTGAYVYSTVVRDPSIDVITEV